MRAGSVVGAKDEVAVQSRDRRWHLTWRSEVDLLGHRESGGLCQTSAYAHFYRRGSKVMAGAGRYPQAFRQREASCAQQLPELQLLHAECEIDTRIVIDVTHRDRSRQVRTRQRPVDFGDFDRALGTLPGAVESQSHVRPISELWRVASAIRQRCETRTARPDVDVKTQRIGVRPKIQVAVCDTAIEQRVTFAPHVEQMADVETACL